MARHRQVGPAGVQLAGILIVLELDGEELIEHAAAKLGRLDGEEHLDAPEEIAGHPVGAAREHQRLAAVVLEIESPRVFQIAADDAADADVLAQALDAGHEAAGAAHDQVDAHPRLRGRIQVVDRGLVDEVVHLGEEAGGPAGPGVVRLAGDQRLDAVVKIERRHQ